MQLGRLISIEGLDGAGKTTLADSLAQAIRARGIEISLLREPGGVVASERVRELVSDPRLQLAARAEALLYAAARAQLVHERVRPDLKRGCWVLLDRYTDSSLAYQGAARGLGVASVRELNMFATDGLQTDRTILLRVDPTTGRARLGIRGTTSDRFELENESFFASVATAYDELAVREPLRIRVVDAEREPAAVLAAALSELEDLL